MSQRHRFHYKKFIKREHLVFVDLECSSWNELSQGSIADKMEIIEIGAVRMYQGVIADSFTSLVRPTEHLNLSDFIQTLTGISQEMVNISRTVKPVLKDFEDWVFNPLYFGTPCLGSWGEFDEHHYFRECTRKNLSTRLREIPWFDVRNALAVEIGKGKGLKKAALSLSLHFEGANHRAHADAQNAANIVHTLRTQFFERGLNSLEDVEESETGSQEIF